MESLSSSDVVIVAVGFIFAVILEILYQGEKKKPRKIGYLYLAVLIGCIGFVSWIIGKSIFSSLFIVIVFTFFHLPKHENQDN